jgi:ribosomal-protein-alanine N-acetyltransferase
MTTYPTFTTTRLTLRQLHQKDAQALFTLYTSPEVLTYFGMEPLESIAKAEGIIEARQEAAGLAPMRWAITDQGDNLIGTCGFHATSEPHKRCEIGYDLLPIHWGKGYMTEALQPVIDYLFREVGVVRVGAVIIPENAGSSRVVEKLGFTREGLLRDYIMQDQLSHDVYSYSMLKKEWADGVMS